MLISMSRILATIMSNIKILSIANVVCGENLSNAKSQVAEEAGEYFKGNKVLQNDLNNIREWAIRWKMEFNVDKCKIMHIGRSNPQHTYCMDSAELTKTVKEKDLGVLMESSLELDQHITGIVGRANRMLGLIKIGFACLDKKNHELLSSFGEVPTRILCPDLVTL